MKLRMSQLFTRTRREAPKDEVSKNAQLLIRGGYVHKEMAGVYSFLPLGVQVLRHIEDILREEMNAVGGQEVQLATLHPSEPWKQTGAWDMVDVVFKIRSRTQKEYTIAQSAEEVINPIASEYVRSYKDLPVAIYQIGQKYRDELRAKSGIMRGREFGMKDMYSFHATQEDFERFYDVVKKAYVRVFKRCGLVAKVTEASGGAFSNKISYEFMVLTDAGEDTIVYCEACDFCANVEVTDVKESDPCKHCKAPLKQGVASEVGNVFDLGTRYPEVFNFTYKDEAGNKQHPIVGCYGIGTTRLMGVVVEALSDDAGIVWPHSIAPALVHIIEIGTGNGSALFERLAGALYDDRDVSPGIKFGDADLIGLPYRVVVSDTTKAKGVVEVKERATGLVREMTEDEFIQLVS
ncbi:MAG: aminoacyl--tRNA ligase-related protein [bacterium]|nr:aminoacyl--tRNA ligase-related protein [bacterium]